MNQSRLAVLILALSAGSAMAAVDPGLLGLVMPDAKILSGILVGQAETTPFGQYVLSQIQFNDSGFQMFLTATGFDPRHDLSEVLAATNADSTTSQKNGIVLGRGTFQPTLIAAAATAAGGTVTQYGGISVITSPHRGNPVSVAFLDSSTVVIGTTDAVEATIDRRGGPAYSGPLAQQAVTASAANQAWFATTTPLSQFLNGKLGNANLGSMTQSNLLGAVIAASGGLNFGSAAVTISADAVTTSAQNAQALADVLKFLVGMVQSNSQASNPALGALASSATFTINGAVMHLAVSLPEQQIEQLFVPHAAGAKRRVALR